MLYRYSKKLIIILSLLIILPLLTLHLSRGLFFGSPFYPSEISRALNNPYMGWAPSAEGGPYEVPHRLVYINTTWSELEPQKGIYDFDHLEQKYKFSYWKSIGVNIIFRVNMDFPNQDISMDIPDWLYEETGRDGVWYDLDYGRGYSPNYNNPLLIDHHEKLIAALAARYNKNDLVSMVALGSIGHWGEWHTKQDPAISIPFPPLEISDQYVEHYLKYFTDKYLLMRRPFEIAKAGGMGLYNDSFGNPEQTRNFISNVNNGYYDYLANTTQPPMDDYWKYAPSGGEIANPPGLVCFEKNSIDDTLKQIKDSHISWLGPSCPAYKPLQAEDRDRYDQVLNTMGYRFVLHSLKHPPKIKARGVLQCNMVWINKGVAPFYFRWPVEISLSDENGIIVYKTLLDEDIRTWLPGKKKIMFPLHIPADLCNGEYTLCVSILDPCTNEPGVELAISNKRADGRYELDQIQVIPSR